MEQEISSSFFGIVAIPLVGFVAAMALVGLKQAEFYFKPIWFGALAFSALGTAVFAMGVIEIGNPGWWPAIYRLTDALSLGRETWRIIGLFFFLFPVSLLVVLLRFPFKLFRWQQSAE